MDRWKNGWKDKWTEGWTDGWTDPSLQDPSGRGWGSKNGLEKLVSPMK